MSGTREQLEGYRPLLLGIAVAPLIAVIPWGVPLHSEPIGTANVLAAQREYCQRHGGRFKEETCLFRDGGGIVVFEIERPPLKTSRETQNWQFEVARTLAEWMARLRQVLPW